MGFSAAQGAAGPTAPLCPPRGAGRGGPTTLLWAGRAAGGGGLWPPRTLAATRTKALGQAGGRHSCAGRALAMGGGTAERRQLPATRQLREARPARCSVRVAHHGGGSWREGTRPQPAGPRTAGSTQAEPEAAFSLMRKKRVSKNKCGTGGHWPSPLPQRLLLLGGQPCGQRAGAKGGERCQPAGRRRPRPPRALPAPTAPPTRQPPRSSQTASSRWS